MAVPTTESVEIVPGIKNADTSAAVATTEPMVNDLDEMSDEDVTAKVLKQGPLVSTSSCKDSFSRSLAI